MKDKIQSIFFSEDGEAVWNDLTNRYLDRCTVVTSCRAAQCKFFKSDERIKAISLLFQIGYGVRTNRDVIPLLKMFRQEVATWLGMFSECTFIYWLEDLAFLKELQCEI